MSKLTSQGRCEGIDIRRESSYPLTRTRSVDPVGLVNTRRAKTFFNKFERLKGKGVDF